MQGPIPLGWDGHLHAGCARRMGSVHFMPMGWVPSLQMTLPSPTFPVTRRPSGCLTAGHGSLPGLAGHTLSISSRPRPQSSHVRPAVETMSPLSPLTRLPRGVPAQRHASSAAVTAGLRMIPSNYGTLPPWPASQSQSLASRFRCRLEYLRRNQVITIRHFLSVRRPTASSAANSRKKKKKKSYANPAYLAVVSIQVLPPIPKSPRRNSNAGSLATGRPGGQKKKKCIDRNASRQDPGPPGP